MMGYFFFIFSVLCVFISAFCASRSDGGFSISQVFSLQNGMDLFKYLKFVMFSILIIIC